jgi:pilus assembly protein CpaF
VYEMVASSIDLVIQVSRFSDGTRKITAITEVTGNIVDGMPELKDIFIFEHQGLDKSGRILGEFRPTGYVPKCFDDIVKRGIDLKAEMFLPHKSVPAQ